MVEAAAGYGKTVFGAELVEAWGAVPIEVLLEPGEVSGDLLAARLRAAVARAGFTDAAEAMNAAGADPVGAVDAMLDALVQESCAIIVDDAHHAARGAGELIDRIAARVVSPQRLVVLARQLPEGSERLRRAEAVALVEGDMALRADETLALCRSGFGLDVSDADARLLDAATGGWTAAAVLAVSRAKRTDTPLRDLAGVGGESGELSISIGAILDELLVALGPDRGLVAQIAPLPLLDQELCSAVTGQPAFFDRARALGLPLTPARDGWWELPGPVRDHLAKLAKPDPRVLVQAAALYQQRGQLGMALQILLGAGDAESAVRMLAEANLPAIDRLDALELLAVLDRLPSSVLDHHPWARFKVARACGVAALLGPRAQLIAWLDEHVDKDPDPALRRAIDAEFALDVLNSDSPAEAEALGRRVLDSVSANEQFTRARALTVIGSALCWRRDADGAVLEDCLREGGRYFAEASELYVSLGYREGATGAAAPRAIWSELGAGRPLAALEILDGTLADCTGRPVRVGRMLYHRAEVLVELGRFDEAEADCEEAERIGHRLGDELILTQSHWGRMTVASLRGDSELTMHHADLAEAMRGDWWGVLAAELLAKAADCLDRVGLTAEAWKRLSRAQANGSRAERWIAMSECALLARHGDPLLAEERLSVVHQHGVFPREHWRVALLRAYAALRRGDAGAGALAVLAFEEAARIAQPNAPLIKERELTQSLLALALETGSAAAAALETSSGCRYVVVRHGDTVTGLGHAHVALNLVRPDGTRGSTVRDWPRAQQACAEIASDLGLVMPHKQSRHLSAEQRARAVIHKPAEMGIRHELRQRVDTALSEATDAKTLAAALRRHGVRWHNTNRDGRKGFSFSAEERSDIWIAGGEIDASRRQVAQRLKTNASRVQQEQQHQELEVQQRIANDPALADFLEAQRLVSLGNADPPAAGPLTPAEAEPERSHLDRTRGSDLDNGPDR